ncbi:MAG TPA: acyl-CoA dehydrogenase family protein [Chloroflexaceae bacterium]|nr:acyl-CoA dehydrogenase family protein [Chloroflexaceae bacterium]
MSLLPLTERQAAIVALADALAARNAERAAAHDRDGSFPHASYADMHAAGYLRLAIPAVYGGAGAGVLDMTLAQERLARGDGATALAAGMLVQLVGKVAEEGAWPEPVLAAVCRELAAEGGLINSVVTEPELGSVSRGGVPRTTAAPAPGGWRVSGHKIFATGGPALRFLVVGVVVPPPIGGPEGATASAIVRADAPGVRHAATWGDSLSMRTAGNDDFTFDEVFVPEGWLVGLRPLGAPAPPGKAPGLSGWSLPVAAVYLGIGQAACDAACAYASSRRPPSLPGPIADLPHIQQWIGRMQVGLDAARAVMHETARAWDERPELRPALGPRVAGAKYLATSAACEATELALRVAGGFSLTRALPLERYFRDARAGLFNPPQDDLALAQVGRAALARRAEGGGG